MQVEHGPVILLGRRAERFFTTFSKRKVRTGRKEAFTLAIMPHDPAEVAPENVAAQVPWLYNRPLVFDFP